MDAKQVSQAIRWSCQAQRRFYCFNDCDTVTQHITEIKTIDDLMQLHSDIELSGTSLTVFRAGKKGIWAIDCMACSPTQRHLFMTRQMHDELQGLTEAEQASIKTLTILQDQI